MTEKKFIIDGMKLSYEGPFDIIEFYKRVEQWITANNKEKEIKKKAEHVKPNGKNIEWSIEIWEDVADYARSLVKMRAIFTDVKEVQIKKGKTKKRLNKGSVLIILDGILETDLAGKWQQKPMFVFLRAIADKFIYKFHMNKIEDKLAADVNDLHNTLNDFFSVYKL